MRSSSKGAISPDDKTSFWHWSSGRLLRRAVRCAALAGTVQVKVVVVEECQGGGVSCLCVSIHIFLRLGILSFMAAMSARCAFRSPTLAGTTRVKVIGMKEHKGGGVCPVSQPAYTILCGAARSLLSRCYPSTLVQRTGRECMVVREEGGGAEHDPRTPS